MFCSSVGPLPCQSLPHDFLNSHLPPAGTQGMLVSRVGSGLVDILLILCFFALAEISTSVRSENI